MSSSKSFKSAAEAEKFYNKTVAEKLKKGYTEEEGEEGDGEEGEEEGEEGEDEGEVLTYSFVLVLSMFCASYFNIYEIALIIHSQEGEGEEGEEGDDGEFLKQLTATKRDALLATIPFVDKPVHFSELQEAEIEWDEEEGYPNVINYSQVREWGLCDRMDLSTERGI